MALRCGKIPKKQGDIQVAHFLRTKPADRLSLCLPIRCARSARNADFPPPLRGLQATRARLRKHGVAHCFIAEEGWLKREFKRRVLRLVWRPDLPHHP